MIDNASLLYPFLRSVDSAIPGIKRRRYLEDNLGAVSLHLSPEDIQRLNAALGAEGVTGARYNEHGLSMLDR